MTIPESVYRWAGAAVALFLCNGAIAAAPASHFGVFVYANFCVSAMSGDLYGNRMTLLRSPDATTLLFEYTDGSTHGLVATDLKLDTPHDTISFAVQVEGAPRSALSGAFSPDGQSVTLHGLPFGGDEATVLTRVTNFAAPAKNCKK